MKSLDGTMNIMHIEKARKNKRTRINRNTKSYPLSKHYQSRNQRHKLSDIRIPLFSQCSELQQSSAVVERRKKF